MNYTNWFPCEADRIHAYVAHITPLYRICVSPGCTDVAISIVTDSRELWEYCSTYLPQVHEHTSKATIYYLLNTPEPFIASSGQLTLQRYENAGYNDAAVDLTHRVALIAGTRHYGLLKSIISGLQSTIKASAWRQGLHATAFQTKKLGALLVGHAGKGKTTLTMPFIQMFSEVEICTDDWCDVVLSQSHNPIAIGVETNISFNTSTITGLIHEKLIPESFLSKPSIPHGYRDKIVASLTEVTPRVVPQTRVDVMFMLTNKEAVRIEENPDPIWLAQEFAAMSTHSPFNYFSHVVPSDTQWASWQNQAPHATHAAQLAMTQMQQFAVHVVERIRARDIRLVLIPESHDIPILEKINYMRMCMGISS